MNMMKIKNMKKNTVISIAVVLIFALALTTTVTILNQSSAATTKPAQVKNLKKVKVGKSSVKINFKKVKGATGYQILIYEKALLEDSDMLTPIVYARETKKNTYNIKNLMPGMTYKIKVRAFKKDKKGKVTYGKFKSINVKTTGKINKTFVVCNSCIVAVPNANALGDHFDAALKIHKEIHAGSTINWR